MFSDLLVINKTNKYEPERTVYYSDNKCTIVSKENSRMSRYQLINGSCLPESDFYSCLQRIFQNHTRYYNSICSYNERSQGFEIQNCSETEKEDNYINCVPTINSQQLVKCQKYCLTTSQLFTYNEEKNECTCRDCPDPDDQFIKMSVNICLPKSKILYCKLSCNGTCDEQGVCTPCEEGNVSIQNQCVAQMSYVHCEKYVNKATNLLCLPLDENGNVQQIKEWKTNWDNMKQTNYKVGYCKYPNIAKDYCYSTSEEYYKDNVCYTVMTYYDNSSGRCSYCRPEQQVDDNRMQCIKSQNYSFPLSAYISIILISCVLFLTLLFTIIQRVRINAHTHTRMQDIWQKMEEVAKLDTTDEWPLLDFEFPLNLQSPKLGQDEQKGNVKPFTFSQEPFGATQAGGALFKPPNLFFLPENSGQKNPQEQHEKLQNNEQ